MSEKREETFTFMLKYWLRKKRMLFNFNRKGFYLIVRERILFNSEIKGFYLILTVKLLFFVKQSDVILCKV